MIIGSDFNVILDADLDGTGGKPQVKESCKQIDNLCSSFDLIDIWRIAYHASLVITVSYNKEVNMKLCLNIFLDISSFPLL